MRKVVVLVAVIVTALHIAGSAVANPIGVSITGSGNVTYPDFPTQGETTVERTIISARVLPSGEPHGSILVMSQYGFTKADVTCMQVVGDTVYVGGTLDPGFDFYLGSTFSQIAFGVRDGDPDLVASVILRRTDLNPCEFLSAFEPVFTVDQGDFVITGL